jgi:hypothetical protein
MAATSAKATTGRPGWLGWLGRPKNGDDEMAKYHFKAQWKGLRATRSAGGGDIVFHNYEHHTDSEKDAELLRNTKGVYEMPPAPEPEVGPLADETLEGAAPKPEKKPARRGRSKRGGKG